MTQAYIEVVLTMNLDEAKKVRDKLGEDFKGDTASPYYALFVALKEAAAA